jgi:hypothetical protein
MIEKSWSIGPLEVSITQQSSLMEYIEVSEVEQYRTYNVTSFYKMTSNVGIKAISETRSRISRIVAIVSHHPVCPFRNEELISFYIFREERVSFISRIQIGFIDLDEFFFPIFLDKDRST